jgi:hypothetical protein
MTIQHTNQAFHLRPFTKRKRLSAPRVNHAEEIYPSKRPNLRTACAIRA